MYETPVNLDSTHLSDCLFHIALRRQLQSKLPLSCAKSSKKVFLGPWFLWGGDTPDFGHAFSNYCAHFQSCDWFWLSSVQRAQRVADEKRKYKIKEDRIIVVKPKSADDYLGRPNKAYLLTYLRVKAASFERYQSDRWCWVICVWLY